MLETVKADVTFATQKLAHVNVPDQDVRLSDRTLPVTDGSFTLDTEKDQTISYEVVFEP